MARLLIRFPKRVKVGNYGAEAPFRGYIPSFDRTSAEKFTEPRQELVRVDEMMFDCFAETPARGAVERMIVQLLFPRPLLLAYQKCRNEPSLSLTVLGENPISIEFFMASSLRRFYGGQLFAPLL